MADTSGESELTPQGESGMPGATAIEVVGRSPGQLFWIRFRRDKVALGALAFLVLLVGVALLAPMIARQVIHHGPNDLFIHEPVKMVNEFGLPLGPNGEFWFGADRSGRDLFVRVIYGARTSLVVGVVATGFAVFVGVVLGLIAGYYGGWRDTLISAYHRHRPVVPVAALCHRDRGGLLGLHRGVLRWADKTRVTTRDLRDRAVQLAQHRPRGSGQHAVAPRAGIRRRQPVPRGQRFHDHLSRIAAQSGGSDHRLLDPD